MLHACFVRSPFARARVVGIDTSAALALDGVHAVFTAEDLHPDVHDPWYTIIGKEIPDTPRPPMAEGEVRFVGDLVALVVAEDRYVAEDAAELVDVDYDPLPDVSDYVEAHGSSELVHQGYEGNVAGYLRGRKPEAVDEACASAALVVTETIHQQAYVPVPMETRGIIVEWSGGELTIWTGTQAPHEVRAFCSRLLGLDEHRIRVIMRDTGGGFGQKVNPLREDMCLMLAARKLPAAVKWIEDRRENLLAAGQARHEHGEAKMAFAEDGALLAAYIDHVQDVGAYPTPWPVGTAAAVGMIFPGPYRIPAAGWTTTSVFSNTAGRTAYRGPWQFESVAREMLLDIAARRMDVDPIDLRRRNLLGLEDLPYRNANGMTYDHISPSEVFELGLEMLDYEAFRREQAEAREAGRYLGVGTCSYVEPTTTGMGYYGTEGATIRIEPSGKVNVYVAGGSTGNSLETTAVQLAADALGVDIEDVNTIQGDTAVTPFGLGTGGSRSGSMLAGAIGETAATLRERIVAIAAHKLEAAPEDIELSHGRATVRGTPAIGTDDGGDRHDRLRRPGVVAARRPARARGQRPVPHAGPQHLGQRHPRLHLRGRHHDRRGHPPALHRERGLRPHDQPERGRGPDRGRDGAGHRRRALRAPRLRRGRQPGHDHLRRLPDPHDRRGAGHRDRPHRDTRSRPGRLQGRRRRGCDRGTAGRRQRRRRRARPVRRDHHPPAPDAGGDHRAPGGPGMTSPAGGA